MWRKKGKILLADDEPDFVKMLKFRLKSQGYNVIVARDGIETVDKAKRFQPDLILLDIMMPKLDGEIVITRLKADPKIRQIPIIMLSALGGQHDIQMCENLGAEDYIIKPFEAQVLLEKISNLLK